MNLKKTSTADLIAELETRQGVQKVKTGRYQGHEIKGKYGENDIEAEFALAISLDEICSTPDSLSTQP